MVRISNRIRVRIARSKESAVRIVTSCEIKEGKRDEKTRLLAKVSCFTK
jgi:hypothetical protein